MSKLLEITVQLGRKKLKTLQIGLEDRIIMQYEIK
jgi:hypothetical protein